MLDNISRLDRNKKGFSNIIFDQKLEEDDYNQARFRSNLKKRGLRDIEKYFKDKQARGLGGVEGVLIVESNA